MGQLRAKEDQMLTLGEWWSRRFLQLRQCLSSIEEVGLPPSSRRAVGQSGDPSLVFVSPSVFSPCCRPRCFLCRRVGERSAPAVTILPCLRVCGSVCVRVRCS